MVTIRAITGLPGSDPVSNSVRRGGIGEAEVRDTDYQESAFDEG